MKKRRAPRLLKLGPFHDPLRHPWPPLAILVHRYSYNSTGMKDFRVKLNPVIGMKSDRGKLKRGTSINVIVKFLLSALIMSFVFMPQLNLSEYFVM